MHAMRWIRVVLADDFPMVRIGIRSLLERAADIQVVGEAANGEEVLAMVREINPDVLVLDIKMPRMDGVDVVRNLKSESVSLRILALSAYAEKEFVLSLFEIGVDGYLLKDEAPDMIVDAVRSIAKGGQGWFSRRVAAALAGYLKDGGRSYPEADPPGAAGVGTGRPGKDQPGDCAELEGQPEHSREVHDPHLQQT